MRRASLTKNRLAERREAQLSRPGAREGLHDVPGACAAYQRVLDRFGQAPKSITADAAREARRRLACYKLTW
jgi:hypothetical protein